MTKHMSDYKSDSIKHLAKMDHIRMRPTAYMPDTGMEGQFHVFKEILDNSIDEFVNDMPSKHTLSLFMFLDRKRNTYQLAVHDTGRGIPIGKMIDVFTKPNTSGKFNTDNYALSAGTFGIGAKVTTALSSYFRVVTYRTRVGDAIISHDSIPDAPNIVPNTTGVRGTFVIYEPDKTIFSHITAFMEHGSDIIIEYLSKLSIFCKYRITFTVLPTPLSDEVKTSNTQMFLKTIDGWLTQSIPTFDSKLLNTDEYLVKYFGLKRPFDSTLTLQSSIDDLRVEIKLGMMKVNTVPSNNKLTFVNGIVFTDKVSHHIKMTWAFLKAAIAKHIENEDILDYFLNRYKLPIWLTMDVQYSGAQFSGTIKHQFTDVSFVPIYRTMLQRFAPMLHNTDYELVTMILEHVLYSYTAYSNKAFTNKSTSFTTILNRPTKFSDCSTKDRSEAELFLIEGDSAKSDQGRDSDKQASYILTGKPFNSVVSKDKVNVSLARLKKNAIYQDIIHILGIVPGSSDLSTLNFGKIFIATDADTDGYHIANIILSNLYILCPALIENGHVYVVVPPLFSVKLKNTSTTFYARDTDELQTMLAYHLYWRCFNIRVESYKGNTCVVNGELDRTMFVAFCKIVIKVGEAITTLSTEYGIPAVILEQLSLIASVMNNRIDEDTVAVIGKVLGGDIRYSKENRVLIISLGTEDIIVPLDKFNDIVHKRLSALYSEFEYANLRVYITTKNSNEFKDSPISIVQLYESFRSLDNLFTIERNKGLGLMSPKDRTITCMSPETRRTYQISSIGDLKTMFNVMGTDTSTRKRLVADDTII